MCRTRTGSNSHNHDNVVSNQALCDTMSRAVTPLIKNLTKWNQVGKLNYHSTTWNNNMFILDKYHHWLDIHQQMHTKQKWLCWQVTTRFFLWSPCKVIKLKSYVDYNVKSMYMYQILIIFYSFLFSFTSIMWPNFSVHCTCINLRIVFILYDI